MTISPGVTVYLDTNALIYITEGNGRFRTQIEAFLREADDASAKLITSELSITECLVVPLRNRNERLVAVYSELFDSLVAPIPIDRSILIQAARLRARTLRLRTPDAIHLACAEEAKAEVFVTGDAGIPVSSPMLRYLLTE